MRKKELELVLAPEVAFDAAQLAHGVRGQLSPDSEQSVAILSAEDIILAKLEWYHLGNALSERQWQDITGIMRVQTHRLDLTYLQMMAATLGVSDLLDKALQEAALSP